MSRDANRRASSDWVQPLSLKAACKRLANSIRIASGGGADDIVPLVAMLSLSNTGMPPIAAAPPNPELRGMLSNTICQQLFTVSAPLHPYLRGADLKNP